MTYFTEKTKMAANGKVEDFEYVTQFFGFTPKSFVDGVYNAINDYIQECFKEMGKILDEEFAKDDERSKSQIRDGCKEIIAKCYRNVDSSMDKMELYMLRNIFVIPPGVLLPEDEVHEFVKDGELTEENINKEIMELKTNIRKEIIFKQMLQTEREKLTKVLEQLKRLERWFDSVCNEINARNLEDVMKSVCTDVLEMKDTLQNQRQLDV